MDTMFSKLAFIFMQGQILETLVDPDQQIRMMWMWKVQFFLNASFDDDVEMAIDQGGRTVTFIRDLITHDPQLC